MTLTEWAKIHARKNAVNVELNKITPLIATAKNPNYKQRLKVRYSELMSEYLELERKGA